MHTQFVLVCECQQQSAVGDQRAINTRIEMCRARDLHLNRVPTRVRKEGRCSRAVLRHAGPIVSGAVYHGGIWRTWSLRLAATIYHFRYSAVDSLAELCSLKWFATPMTVIIIMPILTNKLLKKLKTMNEKIIIKTNTTYW